MKVFINTLGTTLAIAACSLLLISSNGCATLKAQTNETAQQGSSTTSEDDNELTTGPKDKKEKVSPGKIDKDAKKEFTKTDSGLEYRVLRKTDGKKPGPNDRVTVHYKGWLENKEIFDSSYRRGEDITFGLGQVVKGWTEGLQLVGEGGMIELKIPYQLAYGERGQGPIPPKATLYFLVELKKVK